MSKIFSTLALTLLLSGCGFLQPVEISESQTQESIQIPEAPNELITEIDKELPLYTTFYRELEGFSTEGTMATFYKEGEIIKKIHVVHLGETGKRFNEFYFKDGELNTATTTLYNYNSHIMDPDFNELNATIESQTITYPEKKGISKTGDDLALEAHEMLHILEESIDESAEWIYYEKDFFSLSYPSEFIVVPEEQDYGTFVSPDRTVVISVYSPQWTGTPDQLLPQPGENVTSTKEETTPSSGNELGEGTTRTMQWMTMIAGDNSFTRSIVDTRLIGPENSSETRLTWSIQYEDQAAYDRYKNDYIKMKESLIQYAD